ncbi:MAG: cobyrinate a,c-diamide synthase [Planctomycetes bacterium]|nr:cobyrinate a,c-diamide synthase [Planctomycetota bacterium]
MVGEKSIPAYVMGGTNSGAGKTSITLGLARALSRRGMKVQTFKAGPDYLDPSYLALASGRPCYNVDGWMCGLDYVSGLVSEKSRDADLIFVEGVMGLFDGASSTSPEGSTAEIARHLGMPILLVASAASMARSFAALVRGFACFEEGLNLAGVIANRVGSERHAEILSESLIHEKLPPLLGAIPKSAFPVLPERHLGLVSADYGAVDDSFIDKLADACEKHIDVDMLIDMDGGGFRLPSSNSKCVAENTDRIRIGVAKDEAFHFYYADMLEAFAERGVEWVEFSPLNDQALPENIDALWFGGGYPESHAEKLSANSEMLSAVRNFAASGKPVYGECGGLMYLGRSLRDLEGNEFGMAGLVPIVTRMLPRLKRLGLTEVRLLEDCFWGNWGGVLRGHEFHFSEIAEDRLVSDGWIPAYEVSYRRKGETSSEGWVKGNVLASYIHLHFASRPQAIDAFIKKIRDNNE